jgi:hypothetical protein
MARAEKVATFNPMPVSTTLGSAPIDARLREIIGATMKMGHRVRVEAADLGDWSVGVSIIADSAVTPAWTCACGTYVNGWVDQCPECCGKRPDVAGAAAARVLDLAGDIATEEAVLARMESNRDAVRHRRDVAGAALLRQMGAPCAEDRIGEPCHACAARRKELAGFANLEREFAIATLGTALRKVLATDTFLDVLAQMQRAIDEQDPPPSDRVEDLIAWLRTPDAIEVVDAATA